MFEDFKFDFYYKYVNTDFFSDFYINNIGFERCEPLKAKQGPLVKNHYIVHYCIRGSGYFFVENKKYVINEGDIFFIPPLVEITYYPDKNNPWMYYWIEYNNSNPNRIKDRILLDKNTPIYSVENRELFEKLGYSMIKTFVDNDSQQVINHSLNDFNAVSFLFQIFSAIAKERNIENESSDLFKEEQVKKAVIIITNNYQKSDLSLFSISRELHVNGSYLSKSFHEIIGTTITKFILDYRMQKACKLLENKSLKIQTVAHSVGYEDAFYFTRLFTKIYTFPPKEYNNKCSIKK